MPAFKPPETPLADAIDGNVDWAEIRFEFADPILTDNKFDPNKPQLAWGVVQNGQKETWYISASSIETRLNEIGPTAGTTVKVAKIRTGPNAKEVKYQVEYVSGEQSPRDIRQNVINTQGQPTGTAPPQQQATTATTAPAGQPAATEPAAIQQYVYKPLEAFALIAQLAEDEAAIAAIIFEKVKAALPDDTPVEQIHTWARGVVISVGYDILAISRDHRMPFAGLDNVEIYEPPPPPWALDRDELLNLAHDVVVNSPDTATFVKKFFELMVDGHQHITSIHHAKAIVKEKLGYESFPPGADARTQVAAEVWVYADAREGGGDDVEACKEVAKLGRPLNLMPPTKTIKIKQDEEIVID